MNPFCYRKVPLAISCLSPEVSFLDFLYNLLYIADKAFVGNRINLKGDDDAL